MKDQLEAGIVDFVEAALVEASLQCTVLEGSGDDRISEFEPAIIVLIESAVHIVANLYEIEADIIASSPIDDTGSKATHTQLGSFVQAIFPAAIPPNLGVNAAHISEALEAATGDVYSCQGYHPMETQAVTTQRWETNLRVKLQVCANNASPLVASGPIQV